MNVEKIRTFTATAVALAAKIRVKHTAGAATVEVAGAGEQHVGVTEYACAASAEVALKLLNFPGTVEMTASKIIAIGAEVYGSAAGKVSDAAVGSVLGIALEAAGANGDIIEILPFHVLSTTGGTVSVAAGGLSMPATVQAALAELYQGLVKTVQGFIPISLNSFRELAAGVYINGAGNGGILATDTTPVLTNIADGDAARILWAAGNVDQIQSSVQLPPDIDITANLVVHMVASKDANVNNACHLDGEAHFGESDADCFPAAAAANLLIDTKGEYTATILAADLPADPAINGNMTLVIMPEAHAGDVVYLHSVWIEYKKKLLTS